MSDIELVVKIPERIHYGIEKGITVNGSKASQILIDAVKNGTPLPKGHGKIVDINKLIDSKCNECGHIRGVSCIIPCYAVRRMLDADTIIESDNAESEDKR